VKSGGPRLLHCATTASASQRWQARGCRAGCDGFDDLAVVDPLQVDGGDAEVRVTELSLDHIQRHASACHLDCVRVSELVRCETPAHTRPSRRESSAHRARLTAADDPRMLDKCRYAAQSHQRRAGRADCDLGEIAGAGDADHCITLLDEPSDVASRAHPGAVPAANIASNPPGTKTYSKLYVDLRNELAKKAVAAREADKGVFAGDLIQRGVEVAAL
jgi:hypothetical protein